VRSLGVQHTDLNLHNVLVFSPSNRVVLIDFDRAREGIRDENDLRVELARLRRSARKLDPHRTVITDEDLSALKP
jgi:predicted Ser/Thr protein kinase